MSASLSARRDAPVAAEPSLAALDGVVGFRLRRLQGFFVAHWARWFRALGLPITPVQGGILLLIRENAGLTQVALARLLQVEAPTLMQALTPLIETGLVERQRSRRDRRALELRLSPAGGEAAATVGAAMPDHEADLLSGLDPHERTALYALLEKALSSADAAVTRPG